MAMVGVDVDGSCQFSADSQPKSIGLVCGLANSRNDSTMSMSMSVSILDLYSA